MKTNGTLFLILAFALSSCSTYYFNKGNKYYNTMQYDKAINSYVKGTAKKRSDEVKIRLADSYRLNNDYLNAEKSYAEVVNIPGVEPVNRFYFAKALMNNGKYAEAKVEFLNYLKLKNVDAVAQTMVSSCDSFAKFFSDSSLYGLKMVEIPEVTTAFGQVNFGDGIVFAADRERQSSSVKESGWTGRSYLDLFFSCKKEDGSWSVPEPLKGEVNGVFHEGPAVFNKKATTVFFTRSNYASTKKLKKNGNDESNLKVVSAELKGGLWTNLKELSFNSSDYSCGHAALSPDEQTLYFISDMPGGFGGTDIYKVTKIIRDDDSLGWSAPQNLGSDINTPGNEMFPYIRKDGSIYFSSDGHNSLGGLDIYSSSFDGLCWSAPLNLNYPINSSKDDFAFVLNDDDKTGYISSNRNELDKIYEIKLSDPVFLLKGRVTIKGTDEPLPDAVVLVSSNKDSRVQLYPTDENGNYTMKLKAGAEYRVQAIMDDYLKPEALNISTQGKRKSEIFWANFQLERMELEKPIVLDNIYYDLDEWKIREDAALELDRFIALLRNNPQISVELSSHTDARAEDFYNQVLSEKRAKAAVAYLIKNGINPNRLKWKGYGESMLVNGCGNNVKCEELVHQQNRRTEFKVIKIEEIAVGNR